MKLSYGEFELSDDKSLLSLDKIYALLSRTYWAGSRSRDKIEKSIEKSLCYGVYYKGEQIGFARVVTDYSTVYWLCDVVIDEEYRDKGLGKELVKFIVESEQLKDLLGILATKDAHGLYERFGFHKDIDRFMRKPVKQ